jgi:hypothetical protein
VYPQLPNITFSPENFEVLRDYIYILTKIGAYDEADKTVKWAINNITPAFNFPSGCVSCLNI